MSTIPSLSGAGLGDPTPSSDAQQRWDAASAAIEGAGVAWETPEKIDVPPVLTDADAPAEQADSSTDALVRWYRSQRGRAV